MKISAKVADAILTQGATNVIFHSLNMEECFKQNKCSREANFIWELVRFEVPTVERVNEPLACLW